MAIDFWKSTESSSSNEGGDVSADNIKERLKKYKEKRNRDLNKEENIAQSFTRQMEWLTEGAISSVINLPVNVLKFGADVFWFDEQAESLWRATEKVSGFIGKWGLYKDASRTDWIWKSTGEFVWEVLWAWKITKTIWGLKKLKVLADSNVSKWVLNLMTKYGKGFADKYPKLAPTIAAIGKWAGMWAADLAAYWIASKWEITKEDLQFWAWIWAAFPVVKYGAKIAADTKIGKTIFNWAQDLIQSWLSKFSWLEKNLDDIKAFPEMLKNISEGKLDIISLEKKIKNILPKNLKNKTDEIKEIFITSAKQAWNKAVEEQRKFQSVFERSIDDIWKKVEDLWKEYQKLPWAKKIVKGEEILKIQDEIQWTFSKFPSAEERTAMINIQRQIDSFTIAIENWAKINRWDIIKLRQNIKDAIKIDTSPKAKRLYLRASDKVDDTLWVISKDYFELNSRFAPEKQFLDVVKKKYLDKTTGEYKNIISQLNSLSKEEKSKELTRIAKIINIDIKVLKNHINDINAGKKLWEQIWKIENIKTWTELAEQIWKESSSLKALIDTNINKIKKLAKEEEKLKSLDAIKQISELNNEDATIALMKLIWESSPKALKVKEILRKEIWEKSYKELLAFSAFSRISNIKKSWSIASQALNVSVAATAAWIPLGARNSLVISQFLWQPKKIAEILINWELKRKWTSDVSKELIQYVKEGKPLTEKMWDLFTDFSNTNIIK